MPAVADLAMFALTVVAGQLSPGPDLLLILKNSLNSGLKQGMATVVGICFGVTILVSLVVTGLGGVMNRVPWAWDGLRLVGAVYLLWLAFKLFREVWRAKGCSDAASVSGCEPGLGECFREGLITNLTNVKVYVFFASLLAPFLEEDTAGRFVYAGVVAACAWSVWPLFAVAMQNRMVRSVFFRLERPINLVFGLLLAAIALRMLWIGLLARVL